MSEVHLPLGWESIDVGLQRAGLNVRGVASGEAWQHVLPGCRAVVVYGSGGRALWDGFRATLERYPERLERSAHPLDDHVRNVIAAADPVGDASRRWVLCGHGETTFVDFRALAREAGLGWSSHLGLLLNPVYGPWLGLRAACFTTEDLPVDGPLPGLSPCSICPRPCEAMCPADALMGGMKVDRCVDHRERSDACDGGCTAREACVFGREHIYSALEQRYHTHRPSGRRALAAAVGARDRLAFGPGGCS